MLPASRGVIAAALLILLTGCAPTRHYEVVLVLQDFAAGDADFRLKRITAMPLQQSVTYRVAGRSLDAVVRTDWTIEEVMSFIMTGGANAPGQVRYTMAPEQKVGPGEATP